MVRGNQRPQQQQRPHGLVVVHRKWRKRRRGGCTNLGSGLRAHGTSCTGGRLRDLEARSCSAATRVIWGAGDGQPKRRSVCDTTITTAAASRFTRPESRSSRLVGFDDCDSACSLCDCCQDGAKQVLANPKTRRPEVGGNSITELGHHQFEPSRYRGSQGPWVWSLCLDPATRRGHAKGDGCLVWHGSSSSRFRVAAARSAVVPKIRPKPVSLKLLSLYLLRLSIHLRLIVKKFASNWAAWANQIELLFPSDGLSVSHNGRRQVGSGVIETTDESQPWSPMLVGVGCWLVRLAAATTDTNEDPKSDRQESTPMLEQQHQPLPAAGLRYHLSSGSSRLRMRLHLSAVSLITSKRPNRPADLVTIPAQFRAFPTWLLAETCHHFPTQRIRPNLIVGFGDIIRVESCCCCFSCNGSFLGPIQATLLAPSGRLVACTFGNLHRAARWSLSFGPNRQQQAHEPIPGARLPVSRSLKLKLITPVGGNASLFGRPTGPHEATELEALENDSVGPANALAASQQDEAAGWPASDAHPVWRQLDDNDRDHPFDRLAGLLSLGLLASLLLRVMLMLSGDGVGKGSRLAWGKRLQLCLAPSAFSSLIIHPPTLPVAAATTNSCQHYGPLIVVWETLNRVALVVVSLRRDYQPKQQQRAASGNNKLTMAVVPINQLRMRFEPVTGEPVGKHCCRWAACWLTKWLDCLGPRNGGEIRCCQIVENGPKFGPVCVGRSRLEPTEGFQTSRKRKLGSIGRQRQQQRVSLGPICLPKSVAPSDTWSSRGVPLEWAADKLAPAPVVAMDHPSMGRQFARDTFTLTSAGRDNIGSGSRLDKCRCLAVGRAGWLLSVDRAGQQRHGRHEIAPEAGGNPNALTMEIWANSALHGRQEVYDYICIDCCHDPASCGALKVVGGRLAPTSLPQPPLDIVVPRQLQLQCHHRNSGNTWRRSTPPTTRHTPPMATISQLMANEFGGAEEKPTRRWPRLLAEMSATGQVGLVAVLRQLNCNGSSSLLLLSSSSEAGVLGSGRLIRLSGEPLDKEIKLANLLSSHGQQRRPWKPPRASLRAGSGANFASIQLATLTQATTTTTLPTTSLNNNHNNTERHHLVRLCCCCCHYTWKRSCHYYYSRCYYHYHRHRPAPKLGATRGARLPLPPPPPQVEQGRPATDESAHYCCDQRGELLEWTTPLESNQDKRQQQASSPLGQPTKLITRSDKAARRPEWEASSNWGERPRRGSSAARSGPLDSVGGAIVGAPQPSPRPRPERSQLAGRQKPVGLESGGRRRSVGRASLRWPRPEKCDAGPRLLCAYALFLLAAHCLLQAGRWFPVAAAAAAQAAREVDHLSRDAALAAPLGGRPMAPSIIDARRHRIRSGWPLHWAAGDTVGELDAGQERVGAKRLLHRVAAISLRRPRENLASGWRPAARSENKSATKLHSDNSSKDDDHGDDDNNAMAEGRNHLRRHSSLATLPLANHALLMLKPLPLQPEETPRASGARLELAHRTAHEENKLEGPNNDDDDNNYNSAEKRKRNEPQNKLAHRSYNQSGDLPTRSKLPASDWLHEYSSANQDDGDTNGNRNRLLVYGHNNIDGVELPPLLEMIGDKLIVGNINDSDSLGPKAAAKQLPQTSSEGGFELDSGNQNGSRNAKDKIVPAKAKHRQPRGQRSLLRESRGKEVKNRPFSFGSRLARTGFLPHGAASFDGWQQTRPTLRNNMKDDARIERKLFRVETRNDVELYDDDNKDISQTDHYNHHLNGQPKLHHDEREAAGTVDGNAHSAGRGARLAQLSDFGAAWASREPIKSSRRPTNVGPDVALAAARSTIRHSLGRANETEVGPGGHKFGGRLTGSITGDVNSDSDHEQSGEPKLGLAAAAAAAAARAGLSAANFGPEEVARALEAEHRRRIIEKRSPGPPASMDLAKWRNLVGGQQGLQRPYNWAMAAPGGDRLLAAAAAVQAAASSRGSYLNGGADTGSAGAQRLCPAQCNCLWKNGKHFADCSQSPQHQHPTSRHRQANNRLPTGFDPLLQVLNYSSNHLIELPDSAFVNANLNNLQRVYLSNCQLESIHPKAFHNLKLIVELDFSWNKLNFVPLPQMKQLTLMRKLTMRGNPLYSLTETTFSGRISSTSQSRRPNDERDSQSAASGWLNNKLDAASSDHQAVSSKEPDGEPAGRKRWSRNARRLYETYPDLVHGLIQAKRQEQSLQVGDNNFIIRTNAASTNAANNNNNHHQQQTSTQIELLLFEALDWWVQQDEQLASGPSYSSAIYLSGPVVVGSGGGGGVEFDYDEQATLDTSAGNNNELPGSGGLASDVAIQHQTLGDHFAHLQELDFGQCKLTYIKWTTLEGLNQLKRLLLDGNQLSQLSGKLVAALPVGLHQFSLEENPWKCDCRLHSLKRWLLNTRTPLNAPVRCHSTSLATDSPISHHRNPYQRHQWRRSTTRKSARLLQHRLPLHSADKKSQWEPETSHGVSLVNQPDDQPSFGIGQQQHTTRQPKLHYLDEMTLDDFVCVPQAIESHAVDGTLLASPMKLAQATPPSKGHAHDQLAQGPAGSFQMVALETVFRYLEPTLIRPPERVRGAQNGTAPQHGAQGDPPQAASPGPQTPGRQVHRKLVQAKEAERVTLNCSLMAYTESSLDIIWLVDYNHHSTIANGAQQINPIHSSTTTTEIQSPSSSSSSTLLEAPTNAQQRPTVAASGRPFTGTNIGRLPAEERFIVLYDSKLHRSNNTTATSNGQPSMTSSSNHEEEDSSSSWQEFVWGEASLYGSRILIRESRPKTRNSHEFIFKESQIIIQSAQIEDSARYKCMAINKAGNTSVEYVLRVGHQSPPTNSQRDTPLGATISPLYQHSPTTRDQRAHSANNGAYGTSSVGGTFREAALEAANKARILAAQSSQVTGTSTGGGTSMNPSGTWLKSSKTFQITIVVVSVLMAAVIIAFILFCIIIYQIKPAAGITSGPVIATRTEAATLTPLPANSNMMNNIIPLQSFGEFQLKSQLV